MMLISWSGWTLNQVSEGYWHRCPTGDANDILFSLSETPLGTLPMLETKEGRIVQCTAINNYLARELGQHAASQ